jgi:hypothetical protein
VVLPLGQISRLSCMPSRFIIAKTQAINVVIKLRILNSTMSQDSGPLNLYLRYFPGITLVPPRGCLITLAMFITVDRSSPALQEVPTADISSVGRRSRPDLAICVGPMGRLHNPSATREKASHTRAQVFVAHLLKILQPSPVQDPERTNEQFAVSALKADLLRS